MSSVVEPPSMSRARYAVGGWAKRNPSHQPNTGLGLRHRLGREVGLGLVESLLVGLGQMADPANLLVGHPIRRLVREEEARRRLEVNHNRQVREREAHRRQVQKEARRRRLEVHHNLLVHRGRLTLWPIGTGSSRPPGPAWTAWAAAGKLPGWWPLSPARRSSSSAWETTAASEVRSTCQAAALTAAGQCLRRGFKEASLRRPSSGSSKAEGLLGRLLLLQLLASLWT